MLKKDGKSLYNFACINKPKINWNLFKLRTELRHQWWTNKTKSTNNKPGTPKLGSRSSFKSKVFWIHECTALWKFHPISSTKKYLKRYQKIQKSLFPIWKQKVPKFSFFSEKFLFGKSLIVRKRSFKLAKRFFEAETISEKCTGTL